MGEFYKDTNKGAKNAIAEDGRWLIAESAIVADNDDPEKQHRVRAIIPSIDENVIYDEWARPLVFCLGNGYGSFFIPPKGAEIILFGQIGQKFNLFYASVYNEVAQIPPDCDDETVAGFRVPGDLKLIADLDAQLRAARISIEADATINIVAPGGVFINGRKA